MNSVNLDLAWRYASTLVRRKDPINLNYIFELFLYDVCVVIGGNR